MILIITEAPLPFWLKFLTVGTHYLAVARVLVMAAIPTFEQTVSEEAILARSNIYGEQRRLLDAEVQERKDYDGVRTRLANSRNCMPYRSSSRAGCCCQPGHGPDGLDHERYDRLGGLFWNDGLPLRHPSQLWQSVATNVMAPPQRSAARALPASNHVNDFGNAVVWPSCTEAG